MEALIIALVVAVFIIAFIWIVAHVIVRHLPIPAEVVWLVYLVAILLTVLVVFKVIWPFL